MANEVLWKGKAWALVPRPDANVRHDRLRKMMPRIFRTQVEATGKSLWYEKPRRVLVTVKEA